MTVRLIHLPVTLHVTASAHQEALQREFDVMEVEHSDAPNRLRELIDELHERYGSLVDRPQSELERAIELGEQVVDLTFEVPEEVAAASARLSSVLEEVDEYCRAGEHLLTLATPPDVLAYRRWFLGEFVAQVEGAEPTPWEDFVDTGPLEHRTAEEAEDDEAVAASVAGVPTAEVEGLSELRLPADWTVERRADEVVVRPAGELDLQTAPQVRDLVQAVRLEDTRRVELDLSAVSFIDSVGLSMLVSAHQRLDDDGVHLVVVVPSTLQRLFDISGLGQLIELRT